MKIKKIIAMTTASIMMISATMFNCFAAEKTTVTEFNSSTLIGDIDNNETINLNDVDCLAEYLYGIKGVELTETEIDDISPADMNKDGIVDCIDLIYLVNYVAATKNGSNIADYPNDFCSGDIAKHTKDAFKTITNSERNFKDLGEKYGEVFDHVIDDFFENYEIVEKTKNPILYGDMNQDGAIDSRDATAILIWYANKLLNE